jgi:uncharacterized protein YcbX
MALTVKELNIYPIKSARRIALQEAELTATGLAGDRVAMFVDPSGKFITQRQMPEFATLNVRQDEGNFHLSLDDGRALTASATDNEMRVRVWEDMMSATLASEEVNEELSRWFGRELSLCFVDQNTERFADRKWVADSVPVTFADGFPILISTTASLDALNADMQAHGEESVPMERFRANIVIENDIAWDDDFWQVIEIGGIEFDLVKPCTRCIMTTQDQQTGSRSVPTPMPAMARLRMSGDYRVNGVLFGWNAVPLSTGTLRVGDDVKVLAKREYGWPLRKRG